MRRVSGTGQRRSGIGFSKKLSPSAASIFSKRARRAGPITGQVEVGGAFSHVAQFDPR